ncbi:aromatic acid exporter family protein [Streptococcus pneumoniae]|uniref:aromatic acid exporter family protein n=1 Tax=Streptococcus pneumoniae TaxID=1313 RepID=UPI0009FF365B|nr:aromatic acid exporter family protein [Streptococcus pneumoniae]
MSISQRTIKLILATCLACFLAYFLNLSSAVSAGIIALLSLSDTRRSTLKLARNRLFSMLLALAIGVLAFHLSGFHIWSLGLYLAFYVPLAYKMGWEIGITPSTVLVSHLLIQESTSPDLLVNEFLLFAIGTGFALLVNLYMPSREEEIQHYHTLVEEALKLVYLDHSDHLFHQTDYHIHYFEMRQRQSRILRNMAQQINTCHLAVSESLILAQLFSKIAGQLSQTNPASDLLDEIERYLEVFRNRSLPKTRDEFETRATLLQLLREAKTFIQVKVDFYQKYGQ